MAGLIRAMFLTLRAEHDERPADPDHVPWRLRWMKEKYGELDVPTTRSTPFQEGAVFFIEAMSPFVSLRRGAHRGDSGGKLGPTRIRYMLGKG